PPHHRVLLRRGRRHRRAPDLERRGHPRQRLPRLLWHPDPHRPAPQGPVPRPARRRQALLHLAPAQPPARLGDEARGRPQQAGPRRGPRRRPRQAAPRQ
ncbi:hypothetical protein BN1723_020621, partial [Verticillium longisporum]